MTAALHRWALFPVRLSGQQLGALMEDSVSSQEQERLGEASRVALHKTLSCSDLLDLIANLLN